MPERSRELTALGAAVRELRDERDYSQEELGHRAHLHRTYIGGVERGERNVGFENLTLLAEALSVKPSELMRRYERLMRTGKRRRKP